MEQALEKSWVSDEWYGAVGAFFVEVGVYWEYPLPEEMQARMVRSRQGTGGPIYIKVLELMAMMGTACVMVVMRGDRPRRKGETVLMRGGNLAAVQYVIN